MDPLFTTAHHDVFLLFLTRSDLSSINLQYCVLSDIQNGAWSSLCPDVFLDEQDPAPVVL